MVYWAVDKETFSPEVLKTVAFYFVSFLSNDDKSGFLRDNVCRTRHINWLTAVLDAPLFYTDFIFQSCIHSTDKNEIYKYHTKIINML